MRSKPLPTLVRKTIRQELAKWGRKLQSMESVVNRQYDGLTAPSEDLSAINLEQLYLPALAFLFKKTLLTGCMPVKISAGLKLYIYGGIASFGENIEEAITVTAQEIDIPTYAEDRWVYVYLASDGNFIANKYAPHIGTNGDMIPICRVWVEHDATDFDPSLVRDLRPVGVASGNLNHVLRQTFINMFKAVPALITSFVQVIPYSESGSSDLMVQILTDGDNGMYANLTPLPDDEIIIPRPESGLLTQDFVVVAKAVIDNDSPDDLKFEYDVKALTEVLAEYEIPLALVLGVDNIISEISAEMIVTDGIQKYKKDYFLYDMTWQDELPLVTIIKGTASDGTNITTIKEIRDHIDIHTVHSAYFCFSDNGNWDNTLLPIAGISKDYAITVVGINAVVIGSSTPQLTFDIEERLWGNYNSGGTPLTDSPIVAGGAGVSVPSFSNNNISAQAGLFLKTGTSAESGQVDFIMGTIYYTIQKGV